MEAKTLALCMIVKNEERLLARLLDAVSPYVGEIIIVDTGSEDETVAVAESYATQVYYYPLTTSFSAARNYCQSLAHKPWVLVLDADEMPTQALLNWLAAYEPAEHVWGVEILRENKLGGELLQGKSAYEWHVRLYRRERQWVGPLHEHVWISDPKRQVEQAPEEALLLHDKPWVRQKRQDAQYALMAEDSKVYLNLGSGGRPIEGWVNIDISVDVSVKADLLCDLREGLPHKDLSVDMIWADQVLEHMGLHRAGKALADWIRTLKIGGVIVLSTPDLRAVCRAFIKKQLTFMETTQLLYGGQSNMFDYHAMVIDRSWLQGQLDWWGCDKIKWLPSIWWNICVQATKVRHVEVEV